MSQVDLDDVDPDDRRCPICWEHYHVSEDLTLSHAHVKTVCGYIFGHKRITECLDPLCFDTAEHHDKSVQIIPYYIPRSSAQMQGLGNAKIRVVEKLRGVATLCKIISCEPPFYHNTSFEAYRISMPISIQTLAKTCPKICSHCSPCHRTS